MDVLKKLERMDDLLSNTYRMFYVEEDCGGINRLQGLQMFIDDHVSYDSVIAEIGSFSGVSSELFALQCNELYCIDAWEPYWEINSSNVAAGEHNFDKMAENYENIYKVKMKSDIAAANYPDEFFDIVYIDAAHDRENVERDIDAWFPKVKQGGILSGHDYRHNPNIQVYEVVNEKFGATHKIEVYPDTSWAIKK